MRYLHLLFFGLLISYSGIAQTSKSSDELYLEARELILNDKYIEGRRLAFLALERSPSYADILILVGRSYAWEGKNDSASIYLERAITASPQYEDGYVAYLDNLFWDDQLEKADEIILRAKSNFPNPLPDPIIYRESRLLYYREKYDEALELVQPLFDKGYNQEGMLGYLANLQRLRKTNAIGASYDFDSFRGAIEPWNTWSLYGRTRLKYTGSIIARVTQSQRFGGFGTLFELDAYPSIGEKGYAYLNLGGSRGGFFPRLRFGGSYFHNFEGGWEAELGYRYLGFSSVTNIYTFSIGKYIGNWWVNFRPNIIPDETGTSVSGQFNARYYFDTAEDFFSFTLSTGVSPDEETRALNQLLNSYRARVGFQHLFTPKFQTYSYLGYTIDELSAETTRNNFNFTLGVEYRF